MLRFQLGFGSLGLQTEEYNHRCLNSSESRTQILSKGSSMSEQTHSWVLDRMEECGSDSKWSRLQWYHEVVRDVSNTS